MGRETFRNDTRRSSFPEKSYVLVFSSSVAVHIVIKDLSKFIGSSQVFYSMHKSQTNLVPSLFQVCKSN